MTKTDSTAGRIVLLVSHCAGMIDLVALPVWVGTLIARYQLDPQQAGILVTLYLAGGVASSIFFAPRHDRIRGTIAAPVGFGMSALAFVGAAMATDYAWLAVLHTIAGMAAGSGLSFTHGTIGRSANPHRLFALAGLALGIFAIVFLGGAPVLIAATGGPALFAAFGAIMAVAAVLAAVAFPVPDDAIQPRAIVGAGLDRGVWYAIFGISCMALVQATTFSFLERVGIDRDFGRQSVNGVLIALGFINLLPAPLAAALERRVPVQVVLLLGPWIQAALAMVLTNSESFAPYAVAASLFTAVIIFTHTFVFGLIARLDPSGRALSATPAMLMVGAAIGPLLGGTLVKSWGYGSLGMADILIAAVAMACFALVKPRQDVDEHRQIQRVSQ